MEKSKSPSVPAVKPVNSTAVSLPECGCWAHTPPMNIPPRPCDFHAWRLSIDAVRSRTVRSYSLSMSRVAPFLRTWSFRFDKNASAGSGIQHTSAVSDRFRVRGTAESIGRVSVRLRQSCRLGHLDGETAFARISGCRRAPIINRIRSLPGGAGGTSTRRRLHSQMT